MPARKSVVLYFLGGATIGDGRRPGRTVTKPSDVEPWLRQLSEIDIIAASTGVFIASGSTTVGLTDWVKLGQDITTRYQQTDGFVVIHQLATLPAAATVLSLMLKNLGKPVVLCGSPSVQTFTGKAGRARKPATNDHEFGAKANFINAVQVAVSDVREVVVVAGSHIYRGRTIVGPMPSPRGQVLGKIDFGVRFYGHHQSRNVQRLQLRPQFDVRVAVAEYLSGVDIRTTLNITRQTRAIFLYGGEHEPAISNVVTGLRRTISPTLPIVWYWPTDRPGPSGVITIPGPSPSAALLHLMWALGQSANLKPWRKLLTI